MIKRLIAVTAAALSAMVAATVSASTAIADPNQDRAYITVICYGLHSDPTTAGVKRVANELMEYGLTPEKAGELVYYATTIVCPDMYDVVQAAANSYNHRGTNV